MGYSLVYFGVMEPVSRTLSPFFRGTSIGSRPSLSLLVARLAREPLLLTTSAEHIHTRKRKKLPRKRPYPLVIQ